MALKTSLKWIARKIEDAIRTFVAGEGYDQDEVALAGSFDEKTERISLVVGSNRPFDERRWYAGIMNSLRQEFADAPSIPSRIGLVVRNVPRLEQIYHEMMVDDEEIDLTQWFQDAR